MAQRRHTRYQPVSRESSCARRPRNVGCSYASTRGIIGDDVAYQASGIQSCRAIHVIEHEGLESTRVAAGGLEGGAALLVMRHR